MDSALAGKSTLNRLELSGKKEDRYKKILCDTEAVDRLLVDVFLESYEKAPDQIVLDLDGAAVLACECVSVDVAAAPPLDPPALKAGFHAFPVSDSEVRPAHEGPGRQGGDRVAQEQPEQAQQGAAEADRRHRGPR